MTVFVSSKGQVTLPAAMRKRLGITVGTRLELIARRDDVNVFHMAGMNCYART